VFEFCLIFALSLSLASLNVKYRDFYQLWDIALQLGFWLSPIVYDVSAIPSRYQSIYLLNPMARLIGALRAILLFNQLPSISDYLVMLGSIAILMIMGFVIFRSVEGKFAEEL
jgi:lipopolysaccharide transport system permease protein